MAHPFRREAARRRLAGTKPVSGTARPRNDVFDDNTQSERQRDEAGTPIAPRVGDLEDEFGADPKPDPQADRR